MSPSDFALRRSMRCILQNEAKRKPAFSRIVFLNWIPSAVQQIDKVEPFTIKGMSWSWIPQRRSPYWFSHRLRNASLNIHGVGPFRIFSTNPAFTLPCFML
jgi:hypothetical protein